MIDEKDEYMLKNIGVKDSKLLAHKKRCILAPQIERIAKVKIIQVKPAEIDEAIELDNGLNLNWLEAHKMAELINELKPDRAYVDCPSTNLIAFKTYLKKLLKVNVEIISEHKADIKFPVVAAASILAKCAREVEVLEIEKKVNESIGSGYSSNKVCQAFIKKNFERFPKIFRKSWATFKNASQKGLDEF